MAVAFLAEVLILPAMIKLLPRVFGAEALRRRRRAAAAAMVALCLLAAAASSAQSVARPAGHVSVTADYAPNRDDTVELRGRAVRGREDRDLAVAAGDRSGSSKAWSRAVRSAPDCAPARLATPRSPTQSFVSHDAFVELTIGRLDLLAGFGRVVWGRLDEVQPTDVVNPLDVVAVLLRRAQRGAAAGRADAGSAVPLGRASIEAVYVPVFRRGRFDQLDEPTSPFSPAACPGERIAVCLAIGCPDAAAGDRRRRAVGWRGNAQGGARFSATTGRIDWSGRGVRRARAFRASSDRAERAGSGAADRRRRIRGSR